MRIEACIGALVLAVFRGMAAAEEPAGAWLDETGKSISDTDARKSNQGLGAMLLLSKDADAFLKEWDSTPEAHAPSLKTTSQAKRGEIVTAIVMFSGCGDATHPCNPTVAFKVINPDGSVYGETPPTAARRSPMPASKLVAMSEAQLQIRIEPKDQLGEYTVFATFADTGTARTLALKEKFRVIE